jgi:hypothetical protein
MKNLKKFLVVLTILTALFSMNTTALDISIVRTLPESSSPESTFTVTLAMDVNGPGYTGLYEYYPAGWNVTNISCGGVAKSGHIEWLLGFGGCPLEDANITYMLRVPFSGNGTYWFSGNILEMGETTGDDYITIVPYRIIFTRDLPLTVYPDSDITVSIYMDVSEESKPNSLGLVEYFPLGWTISNISNGGIEKNTSIEWIFSPLTSPVQDTNISYVLSAPSEASGTYQFSGQFNYTGDFGSFSDRIIGDGSFFVTPTTIVQCSLIGDMPPCGVVEINEIMALIDQWTTDDSILEDVVALINVWVRAT